MIQFLGFESSKSPSGVLVSDRSKSKLYFLNKKPKYVIAYYVQ